MIKKINKKLFLGFLIVVFLLNVSFVIGQKCGPTPFDCMGTGTCGYKECETVYTACDETATIACYSAVSKCVTVYNNCVAACSGTMNPGCEATCQENLVKCTSAAEKAYSGSASTCASTALGIQEAMLAGGSLLKATCAEGNSCMLDSSAVTDAAFVGTCQSSLSADAKSKAVKDFLGNEGELLKHIDATEEWANAINSQENFKFTLDSKDKFAEMLKNGWLSDKVYGNQNFFLLISEEARSAAAIANFAEPGKYSLSDALLNQVLDFFGIKIPQSPEDVAKLVAKQLAGKAIGEGMKLLQGDNSGPINQALNNIGGDRLGCQSGFLASCSDSRVPGEIGKPNCISGPGSTATNSFTQIPSNGVICIGSIHVIDKNSNNMYSVNSDGNLGVILKNGFFDIHNTGWTEVNVGGKGAFVSDNNVKNLFLLLGGTHTYYGIGTQDTDTYVSNSVVAHLNSDTLFDATKDKSGDEFGKISLKKLTGAIIYKSSEGKLSLSFDHFTLPNYQNAIDLGKIAEGYQLLARGFGDMVLLGNEKFFPLVVRNALKGDSAIVFNKDVKVINTYVARDNSYDYIIKGDNDSTKVIARNQKIIQDSSSLPLELTPRQKNLIYAN